MVRRHGTVQSSTKKELRGDTSDHRRNPVHPGWPCSWPGVWHKPYTCRKRQPAPAQGFLSFHLVQDWCELVLPVECGSKVWEEDEAFAAEDDAWAWVGIRSRSAITLQVRFVVLGKGFGVGFEPNTIVEGFAKVDSRCCYLEMVVEKSAELGRAVEVETFELRSVP